MNNQEILNTAVAALNSRLQDEKAVFDYRGDMPHLTIMGKSFFCVVDPNLTPGTMLDKARNNIYGIDKDTRILFITVNATSKMLDMARQPDINVLDCAGNFNIQYQSGNGNIVLMLANKGEKPITDKLAKPYPVFSEKGLKVIFHLLRDKKNVGRPYREIMEATGVSLGTVKNIIGGLFYSQFVRVENGKRFLINVDRLLMLWAANYGQNLKPKLFQARFSFRSEADRKNWMKIELPDGMQWGGEIAEALTYGYLTPGEFTIYTDRSAAAIMRTGAVIPDANGEIAVYRKFWTGDGANVVPALLVYADLMNASSARCVEAAQKYWENEIKHLF